MVIQKGLVMRQNSMNKSLMISDLKERYTAMLIKFQLVLCFSIFLSFDTPQAASGFSRFHAVMTKNLPSSLASK
jgi:hypothetical protein